MFNDEVSVFSCEKYFVETNLSFIETIWNIEELSREYQTFVTELEEFFNSQLEPDDLHHFKGKTFELSDAKGLLQFPFTMVDDKLKFIETDAWRATILTSILQKKLNPLNDNTRPDRKRKDENESHYSTKL